MTIRKNIQATFSFSHDISKVNTSTSSFFKVTTKYTKDLSSIFAGTCQDAFFGTLINLLSCFTVKKISVTFTPFQTQNLYDYSEEINKFDRIKEKTVFVSSCEEGTVKHAFFTMLIASEISLKINTKPMIDEKEASNTDKVTVAPIETPPPADRTNVIDINLKAQRKELWNFIGGYLTNHPSKEECEVFVTLVNTMNTLDYPTITKKLFVLLAKHLETITLAIPAMQAMITKYPPNCTSL